jgi:hypothetical protein
MLVDIALRTRIPNKYSWGVKSTLGLVIGMGKAVICILRLNKGSLELGPQC